MIPPENPRGNASQDDASEDVGATINASETLGDDRISTPPYRPEPNRRHQDDSTIGIDSFSIRASAEELLARAIQDTDATLAETPSTARRVLSGPVGQRARIGDYEILRQIARGGMGYVYEAVHVRMPQPVALKMLRAGEFASEADIQRFLVEARAVAKLHKHPNIVKIYNISDEGAENYFAMQLVRGGSLKERLKEYGDDPRKAVRLMIPVADAIAYAHRKGILHRDLKPENILVDEDGNPYVTDFGLARRVDAGLRPIRNDRPAPAVEPGVANAGAGNGSQETQAPSVTLKPLDDLESSELEGMVLGTPSYMPPEQALGKLKDVTTLSDVYSLGATLFAVLTGQPPFLGKHVRETLDRVIHDPPPSIRTLNPKVDRDLDAICKKCLEKDPNQRYQSAEAFSRDLERWERGEPIHARMIGQIERIGKWVRREPWKAIVGVGLVLGSLVVGGLILTEIRTRAESERRALLAQIQAQEDSRKLEQARKDNELIQVQNQLNAIKATQATRLANENLRDAGETIRRLVDAFESDLGGDATVQRLRKNLLRQALDFFQLMIRQWTDDETRRLELANAQGQFARIARKLGETKQVADAYKNAIATLKAHLAELPATAVEEQVKTLGLLAESYHETGILHSQTGDPTQARASYIDGLRIRQGLCFCEAHDSELCGDVGTPAQRTELGRSYGYLGDLDRVAGRPREANAAYDASHKIREQLYKNFKDDPAARGPFLFQFARSFGNLAWLGRHSGNLAKAIDYETQSTKLLKGTLDTVRWDNPTTENLEYLDDMSGNLRQTADFQFEAGQLAEALATINVSLENYTKLVKLRPGVHEYALKKAVAEASRTRILMAIGRLDDARLSANAVRTLLAENDDLKDDKRFRLTQAQTADRLGKILLAESKPNEAVREFELARTSLDTLIRLDERNYDYLSESAEVLADLALASQAVDPRSESRARTLASEALSRQAQAASMAPDVKLILDRSKRLNRLFPATEKGR